MDGPAPSGEANFRWRLGVRPLDLRDWIELGSDSDAAIAAKPLLMAQHPDTVFAVLDDVEPESSEVADALVGHLRQRWPDRYRTAELDRSLHPLDAAARLVPEDLILLVERDEGLVFGGGSVCFPNRWDLRSKLGLSMARVHAPVARLNDQLEDPIDGFFARLAPERSYWRLAWNILDTPDQYTPVDGTEAPRPVLPEPDGLFFRIERETMRRFPVTGVVLFTVRTYVAPFPAVSDGGDVAVRLARAVASLPADVRDYKGLAPMADAVIEHLRGISGTS